MTLKLLLKEKGPEWDTGVGDRVATITAESRDKGTAIAAAIAATGSEGIKVTSETQDSG